MKYLLKFVTPFEGIKQYINAALSENNANLGELWLKYAVEPYWNEWAAGQFNEQRIRNELSNPITDLDKLKISIGILEASGIEKIVLAKYEEITELLPPTEEEKVVCIYPTLYLDQSVHGVVGNCVGGNILITINPEISGWEEYLPWVLAHEYNHTVWGYNYFYLMGNSRMDLLASLISEGLADSFAKAVCPHISPYWIRALTVEQEQQQWDILKQYLYQDDNMELHNRFFFGDVVKDTPPFVGYTLGFKVVQLFLEKKPEISFDKLVTLTPGDILNVSGYDSGINL